MLSYKRICSAALFFMLAAYCLFTGMPPRWEVSIVTFADLFFIGLAVSFLFAMGTLILRGQDVACLTAVSTLVGLLVLGQTCDWIHSQPAYTAIQSGRQSLRLFGSSIDPRVADLLASYLMIFIGCASAALAFAACYCAGRKWFVPPAVSVREALHVLAATMRKEMRWHGMRRG